VLPEFAPAAPIVSYCYDRRRSDIEVTGSGVFDGQGYNWWWAVFLTHHDNRPDLLDISRVTNLLIHNLKFENSPQYHIYLKDVLVRLPHCAFGG
jgi:hypothetical protein